MAGFSSGWGELICLGAVGGLRCRLFPVLRWWITYCLALSSLLLLLWCERETESVSECFLLPQRLLRYLCALGLFKRGRQACLAIKLGVEYDVVFLPRREHQSRPSTLLFFPSKLLQRQSFPGPSNKTITDPFIHSSIHNQQCQHKATINKAARRNTHNKGAFFPLTLFFLPPAPQIIDPELQTYTDE